MTKPQQTNVIPLSSATQQTGSRSFPGQTSVGKTKSVSAHTGGSGGGPGDWAHTVETRLSELRTDVRNLLVGGAFVALALAGVGWTVYNSNNEKLQNLAVTQQSIQGKIETLDAKMAGRFDNLELKLNDNTQTSPPDRKN